MKNNYFLLLFFTFVIGFSLRFFWHDVSPPGFTADEAVFGYNAYSLLKTGKDEFGSPWPVALKAFGDWRPALYSYLAIPFIYQFGLTEMAVRMPSIVFGSATILVAAAMAWILTRNGLVAAVSGLILALSPSHTLISRFADMSTLSTFFLGLGVMLFLWWRKRSRMVILAASAVSFVLAAYSYHNARLTGPLLLLVLITLNFYFVCRNLKKIAIAFICGAIVLLPLLLFIIKSPELSLRRGKYESFIAQKGYEIRLWNLVSSNPSQQNPLITRFFHNKPKIILQQFAENYASHFSPNFLFLTGDQNERFRTPGSGVYNLALFFLLPIGFIWCIRQRRLAILPWWTMLSPMVASFGLFVPNSLHTLDSSIPVAVISAIGFWMLVKKFSHLAKILLAISLGGLFVISSVGFLIGYFLTIPSDLKLSWNWYPQTDELIAALNQLPSEEKVLVVGNRNMHQFILFYDQYSPKIYQKEVVASEIPDENGFERVEQFDKFRFVGRFKPSIWRGEKFIVFDRDELPQNFLFDVKDCQKESDKLFVVEEKVIYREGMGLYFLYFVPSNQERAKVDFCF